jgi:NitT/TauT family transport system ATP-binding protein
MIQVMRATVLQLAGVCKTYGLDSGGYVALKNIDLSIEDGEFLCLLGPSGCGKSTLLNIMAGFEPASTGTIAFDNAPVVGAGRDRMMFFQDAGSALLPWLTVEENMRFALRVRRIAKIAWSEIIDKYLTAVDLSQHRDKFPAQLSGGMRQRLQIARALAVEPKLLLMDEPFAALDALTRRRMHIKLLEIWRTSKRTVIFVTHDIGEALTLADRIAVMSVGPESKIIQVFRLDAARPRDLTDPELRKTAANIEAMLAPEIDRSEARIA